MQRKIVYLDHSPVLGGAAISLMELAKRLDNSRFKATVSCNSHRMRKFYERNGIGTTTFRLFPFHHTTAGWYRFSPKGAIHLYQWTVQFRKSVSELSSFLYAIKPDIVHLNSATLIPYTRIIKEHGISVVVHVRESVVKGYHGVRKGWLKGILERNVDETIFICNDNKQTFGCDKGIVIYNPVDFSQYSGKSKKEAREKLGIDKASKVVLYLGGLRPINGPMVFAKAMKRIADEVPDVKFLMPSTCYTPSTSSFSDLKRRIANGLKIYSVRQQVEREIANVNLEEKCIRSDFSDSVVDYYMAADVVAIPFIEPHFARSVMEAGAASIPVVASRIGGIEEVVRDERNGFLFSPGNSEELAYSTITCLKNKQEAMRMGYEGFKLAKLKFDSQLHAKKIMNIYKNLK